MSYIGVSQSGKRWVATLTSARAGYHMALGAFDSPTEAAAAYDEVCVPISLPSVQLSDAPAPLTLTCRLYPAVLLGARFTCFSSTPPPASTHQSLPW